jgi:hypothetical protein
MTTFNNTVAGTENAIVGVAEDGIGTHGTSKTSTGAGGVSDSGVGVHGVSNVGPGVRGDGNGVGVFGNSADGDGVKGHGRRGVVGESETFQGVFGKSRDNAGVVGESDGLHGVFGICHNPNGGGIFGHNDAGGFAGVFDGRISVQGDCVVTGDVQLAGADLAEHFEVTDVRDIEPGTVMVLEGVDRVRVSDSAYDCKVAGVISGAGEYRPGVVLDHRGHAIDRQALALVGKVMCKVDASAAPIDVGDLLTTSATSGHAMKVIDPGRALGAVLGKAMGTCTSGTGIVPILASLQ